MALSAWPSPGLSPMTVSVDASRSSTGRAVARASGSAPTTISRSPFPARAGPPLTGASTSSTPRSASAAAVARAATGPTVLVRMTTAPARKAPAAPVSPNSALSTCA